MGGPVLRISPTSGEAGTLRLIAISGLEASETVTIEIVRGTTVVSTQEKTADVNGTIALGLREIGDNSAGDYIVRVLRGQTTLASSTLTIGSTAQTPTTDVTLTIDPSSAAQGTAFNVTIEGLAAGETVTVDVAFGGESVYSTEKVADDSGLVTLRLTTSDSDDTGAYTVSVQRESETLASADFTLTAASAQPQTTVEPDATVAPDATAEPTLENSDLPVVTITVDPVSGPQGTQHIIRIEGLPANINVSVDLMTQDRVVFSTEKTSSAQGVVEFAIETEEGDTPGEYTVDVRQGDVSFGSATLTIETGDTLITPMPQGTATPQATAEATDEPDATATPDATEPSSDVSIAIEPVSGPRGTSHTLTVMGLTPNETVQFEVRVEGSTILTGDLVADATGTAVTQLTSEESDAPGEYLIDIRRDEALLISGTLTVEEGLLEIMPTDAPERDVTVTIDPETGTAGTTHEVTITGLLPDEVVDIQVEFNGDVVYTTSKTATPNGEATFELVTVEEDEQGVYTVNVLLDETIVGSGTLEVTPLDENTGPEGTDSGDENTGPEGQTDEDPVTVMPVQGEILLDVTDTLEESSSEYTFDGEEGDSIIATLSSEDFDAYLALLGPDGTEIAYNDDFTTLNSQVGPLTLPETGEYTLVVSSYSTYEEQPATGEFTLQVQAVTLEEIRADSPQTLNFSSDAQIYYFSFEGRVGDVIDLTAVSEDGTDTYLTLTDEAGEIITSDDDGGTGYDPEIYQFTLFTAGRYTITVSTTDTTGSAELLLRQES
ncbi:hypothetical protein HC776_02380, partial [bacterium]|nr:hypothetical protein [bacterium]